MPRGADCEQALSEDIRRLWLNDGSCIRLRPEYPGHVWAYDFIEGRRIDGHKFRILIFIEEASRECMALALHGSSNIKTC